MLSEAQQVSLTERCAGLPEPAGDYGIDDFVTNLLATVIAFQTNTTTVERALAFYHANRYDEIRTLADLKAVLARWPSDKEGNAALAVYLWNYKMWTRAQMLRGLADYFERQGVTDQERLRDWALRASFEDFKGQVHGLGIAVFQWLVTRHGVDTVKPDVHVHRFIQSAIGRRASDVEVIEGITEAGRRLDVSVRQLDWAIWETQRERRAAPESGPPWTSSEARTRTPRP